MAKRWLRRFCCGVETRGRPRRPSERRHRAPASSALPRPCSRGPPRRRRSGRAPRRDRPDAPPRPPRRNADPPSTATRNAAPGCSAPSRRARHTPACTADPPSGSASGPAADPARRRLSAAPPPTAPSPPRIAAKRSSRRRNSAGNSSPRTSGPKSHRTTSCRHAAPTREPPWPWANAAFGGGSGRCGRQQRTIRVARATPSPWPESGARRGRLRRLRRRAARKVLR